MSDVYKPGEASMQTQGPGPDLDPVPVPGRLEDSSFDIGSCLGLAWQAFGKQWLVGTGFNFLMFLLMVGLVFIILIPVGLVLGFSFLDDLSENRGGVFLLSIMGASTLISLIIQPVFLVAWFSGALQLVRRQLSMSTLFIVFKHFPAAMGAGLLIATASMLIGFVFSGPYYYFFVESLLEGRMQDFQMDPTSMLWQLLIYGAYPFQLYIYARFFLAFNLITDKQMGGMEALQKSWQMTASIQWMLILYVFVVSIVGFVLYMISFCTLFLALPTVLTFMMSLFGAAISQLLGDHIQRPEPDTGNAAPASPGIERPLPNPYSGESQSGSP